jgi:hypothetical protein
MVLASNWRVVHGAPTACWPQPYNVPGPIVNTASMVGLLNAPTMGIANGSKHAVVIRLRRCTRPET